MSEQHTVSSNKYFILHHANGHLNGHANGQINGHGHTSDGSLNLPFQTFGSAFDALRQTCSGNGAARESLDFIVIDRPGDSYQTKKKPSYQCYVDTRGGDALGDGTDLAPLSDMETAMAHLNDLHQAGQLMLSPGEWIRVSYREVFTATDHEGGRQHRETVAKYLLMIMALLLVIPVVAILGFLFIQAWPALSLSFLFENPQNRMTAGGIWAPLIGTFFLVLGSLVIAAPTGILAGVYLNEYTNDNVITRLINLAVVNLAGVPSIVHGLFGVGAFVYFAGMGRSLLAASCTVAVMTLPVIITSTKEALASVPMSFREACWNMGATRWQTIRTIVLPNSISGILTGVILQVARAAGETAPILFTGAVFFVPIADSGVGSFLPYTLSDRFMALSYHLWTVSTQVQDAPVEVQYGTAVVLIGLVLLVNSLSIGLRIYLRSRKKW